MSLKPYQQPAFELLQRDEFCAIEKVKEHDLIYSVYKHSVKTDPIGFIRVNMLNPNDNQREELA